MQEEWEVCEGQFRRLGREAIATAEPTTYSTIPATVPIPMEMKVHSAWVSRGLRDGVAPFLTRGRSADGAGREALECVGARG